MVISAAYRDGLRVFATKLQLRCLGCISLRHCNTLLAFKRDYKLLNLNAVLLLVLFLLEFIDLIIRSFKNFNIRGVNES